MRFQGKSRLGFYPLPLSEAQRICRFLRLSGGAPASAIDPCVGDGVAVEAITSDAEVLRYGIELDAYRAEQARERNFPNVIQGNTLEVQCAVPFIRLLEPEPPYDWTLGPADSHRTEQSFLSHTHRWLKPGGVLLLRHPWRTAWPNAVRFYAAHFRDVRVYRLEAPECVRYKQVVVIGRDEADVRENVLRTATSPGHGFTTPAWQGIPRKSQPCHPSPKPDTTCR